MSTHRLVLAAVAASFALVTAIPAAAKPNAKPPKVKTAKATTVKTTSAHGPKATAKPTTAHGAQAKAVKPAKTTAKGSAKTTTAPGQAKTKTSVDQAKGSSQKVKGDKSTRTALNEPALTPAPGEPALTPAQLSKTQQKILQNDNLRAKLQSRLPAGQNALSAAGGFRNLGQFVAAVNVSHNQGIDFIALKNLMVGPESLSLGQAIQRLKGVDLTTANTAADVALTNANQEISTSADVNTTKPKARRNDRG